MEYGRAGEFSSGSGGGGGGGANWAPGCTDQAIWATEDDYRAWNNGNNLSAENFSESSFEGPPNKKSKNTQTADSQANNRAKAIGKMFFKTKLCCKFRAGTCPYTTNCNFAHSIEELRRPPPNWHDIVAAHEEGQRVSEPREEFQIPTVVDSYTFVGDSARSYKGRRCKKFYTDEGCPYGDNCTFLHDEQSRARESVAISLNPGSGVGYLVEGVASNVKPPTWKTRICNKWEMTGYCPFGNKCHFAHGAAELHQYGGGLVESESGQSLSVASDSKQGVVVAAKSSADVVGSSMSSIPYSDFHRTGVVSQRTSSANVINQRPGQTPLQKWKGPHKISRIYGDWIDDIE